MLQIADRQREQQGFTEKRLAQGEVSWAYPAFGEWDRERKLREATRLRGAPAAGVSYEKKVLGYLERVLPGHIVLGGLPFRYRDATGWRFCVPDYLVFDFTNKRVCVVEVKLKHTGAASLELEHLYAPVVGKALGYMGFRVQQLEICRWYYPGAGSTKLVRSVPGFLSAEHMPVSGVYVWSGRR